MIVDWEKKSKAWNQRRPRINSVSESDLAILLPNCQWWRVDCDLFTARSTQIGYDDTRIPNNLLISLLLFMSLYKLDSFSLSKLQVGNHCIDCFTKIFTIFDCFTKIFTTFPFNSNWLIVFSSSFKQNLFVIVAVQSFIYL